MSNPQEIEAKYRISDPATYTALLQLRAIDSWQCQPADTPVAQINCYYDTATRQLQKAKYGFRIRQQAGKLIATLKGPSRISGSIHARTEWEESIEQNDPAALSDGIIRQQLTELIGSATLLPILTIYNQRQIILIYNQQQPIIEMALDQGQIEAAGRTSSYTELELELLPAGTEAQLEQAMVYLSKQYAIEPEPMSKLQRGLALLYAQ